MERAEYDVLYEQSVSDPDQFWGTIGQRLDWITPYTIVQNASFDGDVSIKWYEDGVLNACYNCVDRHVAARGDKVALIVQGDEPDDVSHITYKQLKDLVSRFANGLKARGIQKGDRVTIYMPMVGEAVVAMLACARIGAVHSVVFGGFSPEALRDRIVDCDSCAVITADEGVRGGKKIPLKTNVDEALQGVDGVHTVIVMERTGESVAMNQARDIHWRALVGNQSNECACEPMGAEDPLFILYTSGSTGKPKGVLHTTGGYMVYAAYTHAVAFDLQDDDVYWCTADVGWITGHSYIAYGPLANGATSLVFEGVPNYPDWGRFWEVVARHKVSLFYTAPTAIRSLLKEGDQWVQAHDCSSLRILGTVGEPINVEAWQWYFDVVGQGRCPIVDTWWQTETGGHLITPLPHAHTMKPGYASYPFFGVQPLIVDPQTGDECQGECEGALCIKQSWPGQMRTVFRDHDRFIQTYFSTYKGLYFTGDGARRDADGTYRITGRMDDVINVSGHRFGTAELESAVNAHDDVAESAIVGAHHDVTGQAVYAFVILREGVSEDNNLHSAINKILRHKIGPIAKVEWLHVVPSLPKTRSGKIMRRILRKIVHGEVEAIGDTSTLADPAIVDVLIQGAQNTQ